MNNWEAKDEKELFELLVGDWFGKNPTEALAAIRNDKLVRSQYIIGELGLNDQSTVLEVGSGAGFTSKFIAQQVLHLRCYDISESFLDFAKRECSDVKNISFHKLDRNWVIPEQDETFDAIFSDAVFIHLNLFDIYWYLLEFARILKKGGVVFFNICSDSYIDIEKIVQMATFYRQNINSLPNLLCWNSVKAVTEVARRCDFKIKCIKNEINAEFILIKE